jgi:predicted DsbA family dithiol-disulfide isomerase
VYTAAVLLRKAQEHEGEDFEVEWRYLSLEQINSNEGDDWKIWEQPASYPMRSRWAFRGAEAARKQGKEAFDQFHFNLLKARHEDRKELANQETIFDAARDAGLDMEQFEKDFEAATIDQVGVDHEEGVEKYGVFGTPTFVFEGGHSGYLKMRPLPPDDELASTWEQVKGLIAGRPEIGEIKRPVPKKQ